MNLNRSQIESLSRYFSDLSKILVGSTVIGFFAPIGGGLITLSAFLIGSLTAFVCLMFSVRLLK